MPQTTVTMLSALAVSALTLTAHAARADATQLPLLPPGLHHTFEVGFNIDNPPAVRSAIAQATEQALAAGMTVQTVGVDWSELELSEGRYDQNALREKLEAARARGQRSLVWVRAIDSDDVTAPLYLKGTEEAVTLSDVDVGSDRFIESYKRMMDWVVPMVREHDGFALMIANEPDLFLHADPIQTSRVLAFVEAARDHIRSIDPDLAVGVALSNGFDNDDDAGRLRGPQAYHTAIVRATDIGVFNMYCHNRENGADPDVVRSRIQSRIAASEGKAVIFQELGCQSGEQIGSTEEFQQRFFESAYGAMEGTNVRVSVVFQLVDWTDATTQLYADVIMPVVQDEPVFRDNPGLLFEFLQSELGSLGMIHASDGSVKPSWGTFMEALAASR